LYSKDPLLILHVKIDRKDVFPAPEGPIIVKNSPEDNFPEMPLMMAFYDDL
jgi:hypothetical protein